MPANDPKDAADEPRPCPRRHGDPAAGPNHTHQLRGCPVVVGGEHDADRRDDDVEAAVRERQLLSGGVDEVDVQLLRGGAPAGDVEQVGHVVDPGHPGADPGGSQGGVAGAGGDVEDVSRRWRPRRSPPGSRSPPRSARGSCRSPRSSRPVAARRAARSVPRREQYAVGERAAAAPPRIADLERVVIRIALERAVGAVAGSLEEHHVGIRARNVQHRRQARFT